MRIQMRSGAAMRRAEELYRGDSPPIFNQYPGDRPLDLEWWATNPQPEGSSGMRHSAALRLYLEIARNSRIALPENTFPALFDFDDGSKRPDKGAMKVFLEEGLVVGRMMGAQLVFEVTSAGREYLESNR